MPLLRRSPVCRSPLWISQLPIFNFNDFLDWLCFGFTGSDGQRISCSNYQLWILEFLCLPPARLNAQEKFPIPIINFEFWIFKRACLLFKRNFNFVISITLLACNLVCNTLIHFVSNIDFIGGLHNTREHDVVLPHTSVTDTISGRYRCFYEVEPAAFLVFGQLCPWSFFWVGWVYISESTSYTTGACLS